MNKQTILLTMVQALKDNGEGPYLFEVRITYLRADGEIFTRRMGKVRNTSRPYQEEVKSLGKTKMAPIDFEVYYAKLGYVRKGK